VKIKKAFFEKSSSTIDNCPKTKLFEIAFIGRSNVGKSSLLNMLLDRKGIAKVSKTPGKTKLINYFLVNDNIFFVDLPGYGYAKLSKKNKLEISKITQSYFENRIQLKQIFLLIDIRHEIQKADDEFMKYLQSIKKEFNIIFTKKDKIKESQVNKYCLDYLKSLQNIFVNNEYFISSSKTKFGRQEILDYIYKVKF
jgi:GTP-binding protein